MQTIQSVTLIHNLTTDSNNHYRDRVQNFFKEKGVTVHYVPVEGKSSPAVPQEAKKPDIVIVLGGDGTFLRASEQFVDASIPIVGINTGRLGFLTTIEAINMDSYLEKIAVGDFKLEPRLMLALHKVGKGSPQKTPLFALNDVVIKNQNPSQLCTLRLYIHNTLVAVYDADGIIIATPTGTTAYTLAAGGPVMSPEVEAISITPICPHSFSAKAVVIPANKTIRIESHPRNQAVVYAYDGHECGTLSAEESIEVYRAPKPLQMVHFTEDNFYTLLHSKLDWAMNPRWKAGVL